ncbi:MAG: tRNA-intron lyase [Candidatus Aenigmatarchaeota archaeon]
MEREEWEGELIENRIIIWDPDSVTLYDESGYGKPQPETKPERLELDFVEAAFLMERKKLKVWKKENEEKRFLTFQEFIEMASEKMNQFMPQFIVYRDLRNRGFLVKTGFKFGTFFRLYDRGVKLKRGPKAPHEHTKAVVHAVSEEAAFSLPEMSRAVRLAQNIRATMWWAVVDREGDVTYYEIKRITP